MIFLSLGALSFIFFDMYSYNQDPLTQKKLKYVATINDNHKITINDFKMEYNIVSQNFLSKKEKELSEKEIGELILDRLVNKNLIYLYGLEMGISIYDDEIKENIRKYIDFHKDDKFNTELYKQKIKDYGITFKAFEENVRKDLMVEKVFSYLKLKSLKNQEELFYGDLLVDLSYSEIPLKDITLEYTDFKEEDYFNYWLRNKELFKTKEIFNVEIIYEEGQTLENKKTILQKYLKLAKNEIKGKYFKDFDFKDIPKDKVEEILNSKELVKPFEFANGYLLVKIVENIPSREKTYEEAEDEVKKTLIGKDFYDQVEKYVNSLTEFQNNIPMYLMSKRNPSLSEEYDLMIKKNIFSDDKYFISKDRTLVVFRINDKSFSLNRNLTEKEELQMEIFNRLILQKELLKFLKNKYKIELYNQK